MKRFLCGLLAIALVPALSSPSAAPRKPLVSKVEHFYLVSDQSEKLYNFFRDEFRLPVVWPFNNYGDFASGGLTLGNVAMEFVSEKGDRAGVAGSEFKGIAFEPVGDADAAVAELQRRGIPHGEPDSYRFTRDGQERVGWITIDLNGFPPAGAYVFICDYKQREEVAGRRRRASDELLARDGGPLGVTSLKEIVIGVKSVTEASRQWGKLFDSQRPRTGPVFIFGAGPSVRLVRAEVEGIQSITVGVKSLARARQSLTERRRFGGETRGHVWISPASVGGLRIALAED